MIISHGRIFFKSPGLRDRKAVIISHGSMAQEAFPFSKKQYHSPSAGAVDNSANFNIMSCSLVEQGHQLEIDIFETLLPGTGASVT